MLIVTASDVTRFYETFLRPDASEAELIVLGRLTVLVVAVLGVVLAYVGLGATYGLPLLFVLFWRRTTPAVVLTGVFLGLASSIGNLYLAPELFPILVWPITVVPMVLVGYITYDA